MFKVIIRERWATWATYYFTTVFQICQKGVKMSKVIRVSRELMVYLTSVAKEGETPTMTMERLLGVKSPARRIGAVAMTRMASAASQVVMVRAGNYGVIDRLDVGDEVVLPWREDSTNQRALNMGVWRSGKRTGHRHRIVAEYAGLRVMRLA